jgi:hypothetical protein
MSIVRAVWAEPLKYKRSATRGLAFGVPLIYICLALLAFFISFLLSHNTGQPIQIIHENETGWAAITRTFDQFWQLLIVPFGLTILGTLATNTMHANRMWPMVVVQPVSRAALYLAQVVGLMLVILVGMVIIGLGWLLIGLLFGFGPVDWKVVLLSPLVSWLGSFGVVAIQVWMGTRARNFAWPITIGTAGAVISMILNAAGVWMFGPWNYPFMAQTMPLIAIPLSLVVGAVFTIIGMIDFSKQDWV